MFLIYIYTILQVIIFNGYFYFHGWSIAKHGSNSLWMVANEQHHNIEHNINKPIFILLYAFLFAHSENDDECSGDLTTNS